MSCFVSAAPSASRQNTDIGLGFSSPYSNRIIPVLTLGYEATDWKFTGSSAGVQTQLYYHTTYGLSAYKHWRAGTLFNCDIQTGFGLGIYYAERGFRDGTTASIEKVTDLGVGPAILVQWNINSFFIKLESTYGLANLLYTILASSVQDNTVFSVGYRW